MKGLKNELSNLTKGNITGNYVSKFKLVYKKAPRLTVIVMALAFIATLILVGSFECSILERYQVYGIGDVIVEAIEGISLFVVVLLWLIETFAFYMFYSLSNTGQTVDEEREYIVSSTGTMGTAQKITEEKKEEAFDSGSFLTNDGTILGSDLKSKRMYSVKTKGVYGVNGNVLLMGCPGSGKSRCYIIPAILNAIRRGESMIISDPKGELYGKLAELARAHGYTVKIYNTNPEQMLHSDGVDFMKVIGDNEFKIDAFVDTIMVNITGNIDKEFWDKSQINELKFITTYVATNNVGIPKTLAGIYQVMNTNSVQELENLFFNLPEDHPAMPAFRTWAQGDKTVKGNTHGGLQIDLQKLSNKLVQKITGTDEIDLTLPGREKCLYFVSMSDQERSMQWLTALYWTFQIKELVSYADSRKTRALPIKVTFLLDEFYNIGLIPDWDSKISQLRSRNIDATMAIQSLGQLQKMYPDNVWESVIDCCSTMILLATRSLLTAKYWSEYSGEQTAISTSYTKKAHLKGTEDQSPWIETRTTETKRFLYTPHEIITKDKDHILVSTSTFDMCEMEKVDYARHPMCKEIREVVACEHIPDWVRKLSEEERESFHIDDEKFVEEGGWDIELCTEEDFEEEWTKEKQKELDKLIIAKKKELGRYEEDDEEAEALMLYEDREEEGDVEEDAEDIDMNDVTTTKAEYQPKTGKFKKPKVVYNSTYTSSDGETISYVNEKQPVTPKEHEARQAKKVKENEAASSQGKKISKMFDDE